MIFGGLILWETTGKLPGRNHSSGADNKSGSLKKARELNMVLPLD